MGVTSILELSGVDEDPNSEEPAGPRENGTVQVVLLELKDGQWLQGDGFLMFFVCCLLADTQVLSFQHVSRLTTWCCSPFFLAQGVSSQVPWDNAVDLAQKLLEASGELLLVKDVQCCTELAVKLVARSFQRLGGSLFGPFGES